MTPRDYDLFPDFAQTVPGNGYVWWYVDAVSDDGRQALTLIAFLGSVFSPWYAWARKREVADPLQYCSLNVALYGAAGNRWAMTERSRRRLHRTADHLRIGPSSLAWDGSRLIFDIDEVGVPLPARIRGRVRVHPQAFTRREFVLDGHGRHFWRPLAPVSRVEVELTEPRLRWLGNAYWDSNAGARPLEQDFASWNWSRSGQSQGHNQDQAATILYEGLRRPNQPFSLAVKVAADGAIESFTPPAPAQLPATRWWRIARGTRAEGGQAKVIRTLEDTPFYSRSLLRSQFLGEPTDWVHESLSLDRFGRAWVRCLLPFRMPRLR